MNIYLKIICGGLILFLISCFIANPFSMPVKACLSILLFMALKIGLFLVVPLILIAAIIKGLKKLLVKKHKNEI